MKKQGKDAESSRSGFGEYVLESLFNFEGPRKPGRRKPGGKEPSEKGRAGEGSRRTWEHGGVAQMGEHLPCKQGVDSSNLFISTRWRFSTTGCAGARRG